MATSTAQVRKPQVTIAGEKADSANFAWTVPVSSFLNGAPSVKFSTHPEGSDKIVSPNTKELIQKIADAQQAMFSPPEFKNIILNDGNNGVLNFVGYDTGPHHEVMFGGVSNGKTLIHQCARLMFINTSIYEAIKSPTLSNDVDVLKDVESPSAAIKKILEELLAGFVEALDADVDTTESTKNIKKRIHEANQSIINEVWFPILDASADAVIDGFKDAVSTSSSLRMQLKSIILNCYTNGNTDFSVVISQFQTMFQMTFIPSNDGLTPGKFIANKDIVNGGTEKEVIISSLSMYPGPRKFLTTTAVVLQGLPASAETYKNKAAGPEAASWPEQLPSAGQVMVFQVPAWIPTSLLVPKDDTPPKDRTQLDPALQKALDEFNSKKQAEEYESIKTLVQELAKQFYCNVTLGEASANIVTALDVTWEIGKRYTVKQSGGDALFTGFLRDIKHVVSSNTTAPQANTQLIFSHVEANGFTLPNKN